MTNYIFELNITLFQTMKISGGSNDVIVSFQTRHLLPNIEFNLRRQFSFFLVRVAHHQKNSQKFVLGSCYTPMVDHQYFNLLGLGVTLPAAVLFVFLLSYFIFGSYLCSPLSSE